MKPWQKATIYVTLAMLEPLRRALTVCVETSAWPNQWETTDTVVGMIYTGFLTLKAWSSDPEYKTTAGQIPAQPTKE